MADSGKSPDELVTIPGPSEVPALSDSIASKEKEAIEGDSYLHDGKKRDHVRFQRVKEAMGWCAVAFVAFGALGLISISGVWLFHMIAPPTWHWLSDEQVNHIQTLLFSGTVSATLALLARKVYH